MENSIRESIYNIERASEDIQFLENSMENDLSIISTKIELVSYEELSDNCSYNI